MDQSGYPMREGAEISPQMLYLATEGAPSRFLQIGPSTTLSISVDQLFTITTPDSSYTYGPDQLDTTNFPAENPAVVSFIIDQFGDPNSQGIGADLVVWRVEGERLELASKLYGLMNASQNAFAPMDSKPMRVSANQRVQYYDREVPSLGLSARGIVTATQLNQGESLRLDYSCTVVPGVRKLPISVRAQVPLDDFGAPLGIEFAFSYGVIHYYMGLDGRLYKLKEFESPRTVDFALLHASESEREACQIVAVYRDFSDIVFVLNSLLVDGQSVPAN